MEIGLFSYIIDDIEPRISEDDMNQLDRLLLEDNDAMMPAGNVDAVNMEVNHDPSSSLLLAPPPPPVPNHHQSSSVQSNWSTEYSEANLTQRRNLALDPAAVVSKFPNGIPSNRLYGGSSTNKKKIQTAKNINPTEKKQLKRKLADKEAARRSKKKNGDNFDDLQEQVARLYFECQKLKEQNEVLRAQDKETRIEIAKVQVSNRELEFKVIELLKNHCNL